VGAVSRYTVESPSERAVVDATALNTFCCKAIDKEITS